MSDFSEYSQNYWKISQHSEKGIQILWFFECFPYPLNIFHVCGQCLEKGGAFKTIWKKGIRKPFVSQSGPFKIFQSQVS